MVTDVVSPPNEEGVDPNALYQDKRPEANLQQVIDEHINDSTMPRYTVVLENHPGGKIKLPKNVRLYLNNCGPVVVESTEGNNAISYSGGSSLVIIKCKDTDVTVNKPGGLCDFLSMEDCRVKLQGVKTKHTNCKSSSIEAVDHSSGKSTQVDSTASYDKASFERLELERSSVSAQDLKCAVELVAKDNSTVNVSKLNAQTVTALNSTLSLREAKITTLADFADSNITISESTQGIQELQLERSGYVLNDVKVLGDCQLFESSGSLESVQVVGNFEATEGQMTSQSLEVTGDTYYTGLKHIGISDKHSGPVTYTDAVTNLDGSQYENNLTAVGTTTKQRSLSVQGNLSYQGGSCDLRNLTGQGNASITGQVGRNFVRKLNFNGNLAVTGNGESHVELSDAIASSVAVSSFAFGKVGTSGGATTALNGLGYVEIHEAQGDLVITGSKMVSLSDIVGNVSVTGGVVNVGGVQGNLTLTGCTFAVADVSGNVTANDCTGIVKNASSFTGNNTAASVQNVGSWNGGGFLFSGMGPLGPLIKGAPTLRIESPGTLHLFSEEQIIVEGPSRTEVF